MSLWAEELTFGEEGIHSIRRPRKDGQDDVHIGWSTRLGFIASGIKINSELASNELTPLGTRFSVIPPFFKNIIICKF